MINVCDEKDCPLHVDNIWRADTLIAANKQLDELHDISLNYKNLKRFIFLTTNTYESETIPIQCINCINCIYRKPRDMKPEVISMVAKHKLLQ